MLTRMSPLRNVLRRRCRQFCSAKGDDENAKAPPTEEHIGGGMDVNDLPVTKLYRDLFRLAYHIGGLSRKGDNIRAGIRAQFRNNAHVDDQEEILVLKQRAVTALQNYLLYDSACNDPKLREAMTQYDANDKQ